MLNAVQAVQAVRAVLEAKPWIKPGYYRYIAEPDACSELCQPWQEQTIPSDFIGDLFPYMEPSSGDDIAAMVHPHCRCLLHWIGPIDDYKQTLPRVGVYPPFDRKKPKSQ